MVLQKLRQETRSYHEQIDMGLDICNQQLTLARYSNILASFLGFYGPVEIRLSAFRQESMLEEEIAQRKKTPFLLQDVLGLGIDTTVLPICSNLPTLESVSQILGCMYVLEGATLGGQIVARHVQSVLHLDETNGCAFFNSYRHNTGKMWKAFGEMLMSYIYSESAEHAVIASACETFVALNQWLLGEGR